MLTDDRPEAGPDCTCIWSTSSTGFASVIFSDTECPARPHRRTRQAHTDVPPPTGDGQAPERAQGAHHGRPAIRTPRTPR